MYEPEGPEWSADVAPERGSRSEFAYPPAARGEIARLTADLAAANARADRAERERDDPIVRLALQMLAESRLVDLCNGGYVETTTAGGELRVRALELLVARGGAVIARSRGR